MGLFSGITILKREKSEATNGFQTKKINPEINLLRKQKISAVSFAALASPPHKSMGAFVGPSFHQSCFFSFFLRGEKKICQMAVRIKGAK